MMALSVRAPYAEQIVMGEKTVEYRTITTTKRGRVWIYESKGDGEGRGLIIGSVEIVGCREASDDSGSGFAWDLDRPSRLLEPRAPTGRPQPVFFDPFPDEPTSVSTLDDHVAEKTAEAAAKKLSRIEDDLRLARVARDEAERAMHEAERIREAVFGLIAEPAVPPMWTAGTETTGGGLHVPVLVTGDFHWGERITKDNMDGLNEYSVKIAEGRYRRLIDKTIDIALVHLPKNTYPGIIVLRLGDMISGDIHADLRESNELQSVPAVRSLVAAETWGLGALAKAFGKVHVVTVPGNHSRTTEKPQHKRAGGDNYDTLSAWWLESIFAPMDQVTFATSVATDASFTIFGERYLATHGDKTGTGGGKGFIGPAAPILRGMKMVHDQCSKTGAAPAAIFMGHYHVAMRLEYGWANGSLVGYSEFARDGRMTPQAPLQYLLFFNKRYGVTSQWEILTDVKPKARAAGQALVGV